MNITDSLLEQELQRLGQLGEYLRAFGLEQSRWLAGKIQPRLRWYERLIFQEGVPVSLQNWVARKSGWAVVRSAEIGGHRLTITKGSEVIESVVFVLDSDEASGWRIK